MNNKFGMAIFAAALTLSAPAQAIEISDMSVGDIACYDRFGPFNVIGRVVDLNRSNEEVLLENDRGNREWYPVDKFRNVNLCRLTGAARDWAIDQGVEVMSQ